MMDKFDIRIRDYLQVGRQLLLQRHITFLAVTGLVLFYYSGRVALFFYVCFLLLEGIDWTIWRQAESRARMSESRNPPYAAIVVSSILYSMMIGAYAFTLSSIEGPGEHVVPLLFLFTATLFAAINNHQIPTVLAIRLAIYAVSGLLVATADILKTKEPLDSPYWLQLFTILIVIFFLAECCRQFLAFYGDKLKTIEQLKKDREASIQAYRAKTEFLSIVSHELRTPLTSLAGAIQLLHRGAEKHLSEMDGELFSVAKRNSDRLLLLINDLLDFQALDAGKIKLERVAISAGGVVADAIDSVKGMASSRNVSILQTSQQDEVFVFGDHDRLVQVVVNVLSNAIKFSENGSKVEITISTDGQRVSIAVTDFGKGIAPDARDKVFEMFSQADSSDRRMFGGTGLGMAISKMIIEGHGGSIDYSSRLGYGTTFVLTLQQALAGSTGGWGHSEVKLAALSA